MPRRRRGEAEEHEREEEDKTRSASFLPLYIIGGLIAAAIVATTVFKEHARTGHSALGGQCQQTSDCQDKRDRCYRDEGLGHCVRTCSRNKNQCPLGTKCTSIISQAGRRRIRMRKLCLDE